MNSLAGYVATVLVTVVATYLGQFVLPKIKILFWVSHEFLYTLPANSPIPGQLALPQAQPLTFNVLIQSVTIQNFGRKPADWIEIVHRRRPDFFQFNPSLNYTEATTPAGEHVLRVNSVAPKEWFTIQFFSYLQRPELLYIRSNAGHASSMPWMPVRRYPQWLYRVLLFLILTGMGLWAYWLIWASILLFKLTHA